MRALAKPYKDSAYAQYATAVMAMQAGDTDYAEERALRAIELDPEWTKAKLLYARTMLLAGRQDEAIEYTARLIGDDPDPDPDARMELALMLMTAGRDDDALSQINQILLEQPSRADALRMMAIINFRLENLDAARADFQDLLASGRFTMDALYYLARIADVREEHERAARLYSQVKSGPNVVISQRRASALIAYEMDDPQKALQQLEEFGNSSPSHGIDMVFARAQLLASLERYDEALELYDKYVSYRPDDESALLSRAELLLRMDRLDEAVEQYRAAARRWPESSMSLNALGYTLADRTDEYKEAEKLIRKALEYLLCFDTILGPFPDEVSIEEGNLYVAGRQIPMLSEKEPGDVPWGDLGVDTVIEATARHRTREDFEKHLSQGARRVISCVPQKTPPDITALMGVNEDQLKPEHRIVSNGSCTAHCAAPLIKILHEAFGIRRTFLSTVHAYTNEQRLADVPAEDKRRGRAAAENIIPQETNAAQVVTELIPDLAGRLSGASMNVPVPNGSVVDLVCWHDRPVTQTAINEVMRTAASSRWKGIFSVSKNLMYSRLFS